MIYKEGDIVYHKTIGPIIRGADGKWTNENNPGWIGDSLVYIMLEKGQLKLEDDFKVT